MAEWRIYYGDGTTYQGSPEEAPERGVQAIAQVHPDVGWAATSSSDYYVYLPHDWWQGVDVFGLWDYLATPGWKRVLFGRTVNNAEYKAILERAFADLGDKSALLPGERPAG